MSAHGALGLKGYLETQERLFHYLESGRIHPAIVLAGPEREFKMECALALAKYLVAQSNGEKFSVQNEGPIANRITRGLHPDVIVHPFSEQESQIKIETVRQLCLEMEIGSLEGGSKVCIIDECHRLTTASANAFLKSLEEPGAGRYYILPTTQAGSILPTILSRCVIFHFKPNELSDTLSFDPNFEKLLSDYSRSGDFGSLGPILSEKNSCLNFIQFIQAGLRNASFQMPDAPAGFRGLSAVQRIDAFQDAVETEGNLRTNANPSLITENFIRKHFFRDARHG